MWLIAFGFFDRNLEDTKLWFRAFGVFYTLESLILFVVNSKCGCGADQSSDDFQKIKDLQAKNEILEKNNKEL